MSRADPLTEIMWLDFVTWAIGFPELRQAYVNITGRKLPAAPKSGLEQMIDDATGYRDKALFDFAVWVTDEHWGMEDAPAAFRKAVREQRENTVPPLGPERMVERG